MDVHDEFRRKNHYRENQEARVCANCVHYSEWYEDKSCLASRRDKDNGMFSDMWTEPNCTCDLFDSGEDRHDGDR